MAFISPPHTVTTHEAYPQPQQATISAQSSPDTRSQPLHYQHLYEQCDPHNTIQYSVSESEQLRSSDREAAIFHSSSISDSGDGSHTDIQVRSTAVCILSSFTERAVSAKHCGEVIGGDSPALEEGVSLCSLF